jgi:hypothetical protein
MSRYRETLPQLSGDLFLADGGIETDLIFNHGREIPEFAIHTLLPDPAGRKLMSDYFQGYLALAREFEAGFILDSQTWKAHMHWADDLGASEQELRATHIPGTPGRSYSTASSGPRRTPTRRKTAWARRKPSNTMPGNSAGWQKRKSTWFPE